MQNEMIVPKCWLGKLETFQFTVCFKDHCKRFGQVFSRFVECRPLPN